MIGVTRQSARYLAGAITAGLAVGFAPVLVLSALGAAVVAVGFTRSWFRLVWFALGAILVFQTDDGLTPTKLIYLGGVVVAVALALVHLPAVLRKTWAHRFRSAVWGAAILAGWIGLVTSIYSIVVEGSDPQTWARDALTYFLIAAAVPLGIDAATILEPRWARMITVCIGAIAAVGFAAAWITRRGVGTVDSDPSSGQYLLASMATIVVPLALALTMALVGKGLRLWWLALAVAFVLCVLLTGTRTGLVLPLGILGLIGSSSRLRVPPVKALIGLTIGVFAVIVTLPIIGDQVTTAGFGQSRIASAFSVLTDGFAADASGVIRQRASDYASTIAGENPMLGQGLGKVFPNPNPQGVAQSFSLDTAWTYPAKFGWVGILVLIGAILMILYSCIQRAGGPWLREMTVSRVAVLTFAVMLPFSSEDKGVAIGVALLMTLVGSAARASGGAQSTTPPVSSPAHRTLPGRHHAPARTAVTVRPPTAGVP